MEIIKNVARWGNGAGALLPKEWIGNQVKIVLIDRTLDIKKEIFKILEDYLEDILGVYLTGSYARGEQEKDSDIDVIAISTKTKKEIISGKYHVSVIPLVSVKKTLDKHPILVLPRLAEARTIINDSLLKELTSNKINKEDFKGFKEECQRIININKELLALEKENASREIIYSLILRLRGVFLAKCLLKQERYSKKKFLRFIGDDAKKVYEEYSYYKNNNKLEIKIKKLTAEKLVNLLEKELKNL